MPWWANEVRRESEGRVVYSCVSPRREDVEDFALGFSDREGDRPLPVVEVNVAEVPASEVADGDYWGWQETGDDRPLLIAEDEEGVGVGFCAYTAGGNVDLAVAKGEGRVVRLRVTPVVADPANDGAA